MNVFSKNEEIKIFLYEPDLSDSSSLHSELYDLSTTITHQKIILRMEDVDNLPISSLATLLSFFKAMKTTNKVVVVVCSSSLESVIMDCNTGSLIDSIER